MKRRGIFTRLMKSERGNALVMGAATMPLMLASAGFAVDTIHLGVMKRQMQRAADSSAIAGAYALAQDVSPQTAVARDLGKNKYPTLFQAQQVEVGPHGGFDRTVRVQLVAKPRLAFMSIFTKAPAEVSSEAVAALVAEGKFCVLSLYEGTNPGVDVSGGARVELGCGIASNARGPKSIDATGNSFVHASPLMAVGGLDGAASNFADPVKLYPHGTEQTDPLAGLADPPPQTCTNIETVSPNETRDLEPGCYKSLTIKGTANLAPGTYYINGGDLDITAQAKVAGTGVTFVMTGPGGAAGDLRMNGDAQLNLVAPASGEYEGILFYRDRRAANVEAKINGSSTSTFAGAFYFPGSDVTFNGTAGLQVRCFLMIGQVVKFTGDARITNQCPDFGSAPDFTLKFVRLVK